MRRSALLGIFASVGLAGSAAHADPGDLALNRLSYYNSAPAGAPVNFVYGGGCGTASANYAQCLPDNQSFVNLVNELGGALAPPLLTPAGSMGPNGLSASYEMTITGINGSGDYWHQGTLGNPMTNVGQDPTHPTTQQRQTVPNELFVSHVHVRKSFPLGFELGMHASYLHDSNIVAVGLDVRWALFEGFHSGIGYLPNFAVRGSVNTVVGQQQLYLTIVGVDATLSYLLHVAGDLMLSPYIGAQALFILGDSTVIDGTPIRSGYDECTRRHIVMTTDSMGNTTSQLVCDSAGAGAFVPPSNAPNDSHNDMVFLSTRIWRPRAFGGMQIRYGPLIITGEFFYDVMPPQWLNSSDGQSGASGEGRPYNGSQCVAMSPPQSAGGCGAAAPTFATNAQVWQVSFGIGARF